MVGASRGYTHIKMGAEARHAANVTQNSHMSASTYTAAQLQETKSFMI